MSLKSLATVEQYKRFNRVEDNNSVGLASKNFVGNKNNETDEEIQLYLDSASQAIRNYSSRDFTLTKYVEYQFNAIPGNYTTYENINSLLSVNSSNFNVNLSDVKTYGNMIISNYIYGGLTTVEYIGGFAEIPADIVQATIYLASVLSRKKTRIGEQAITNGDSTTTFEVVELPLDVRMTCDNYRNWNTIGSIIISREDYNG